MPLSNRIKTLAFCLCLLVLSIPAYSEVYRLKPIWKKKPSPSIFHSGCQYCELLSEVELIQGSIFKVLSRHFEAKEKSLARYDFDHYNESSRIRELFDDPPPLFEFTDGLWSHWVGPLGRKEIFFVQFSLESRDTPKSIYLLCLANDRLPSSFSGKGTLELKHSLGRMGLYQ